ncbi:glycosyltransferase family 2 protein [Flavobacterium agrisoli]|uniref:Glycosyltransferase family 2 protein n=1 Tax=Flavobacterium agrisoli TaxID=2793066 RepID=A0A934PRB6_9FLAO|nr:glycosyltransferase family 2 protein [Flavobacterium agrisoli]MBK0371248.1 glycosyltransferase family 2 protein [Flavobacterium agrisoli]
MTQNNLSLPLVSIIVPNYNHEKYLTKRLDSIFNQTYSNFEVILLDDCSLDNSSKILLDYVKNPRVSHCVFNEKNSGNTFCQWKKGIDLAKGEYVWIAESDDYCGFDFIEKVIAPLLQNDEVALSYCQSNRVDENDIIVGNWKEHSYSLDRKQFETDFVLDGNYFIEYFLININVIPNASAVIFRKENLKISNEIFSNNHLKSCGDWIIYLQHIINHKVAFVSEIHNNFRFHSNSVIAKTVKLENRVTLIDINLQMRKTMISILKKSNPLNYKTMISKNKSIVKSLKYEKGMYLIQVGEKWKGIFLLFTVYDEFVKRYNLQKKLILKFKNFFS